MNRNGFAPIAILLVVVGVLAVSAGTYFYTRQNTVKEIACTTEAKQCSDGSYVGRTGPKCEFAECPIQTTSTTIEENRSSTSHVSTEGANTKTVVSSTLKALYEISWEERNGGVRFDLVGVSIRNHEDSSANNSLSTVITLHLKTLNNQTTTRGFALPEHLGLLSDETGSLLPPFEQVKVDTEIEGEVRLDVKFAAPVSNQKNFIFTTGGNSNLFFDVNINSDGVISVQKESTSEPVGTVTPPICGRVVRNVPSAYPTIQAAIDAADSGDTVRVAEGTYEGGVSITKSGICLEGAGIDLTALTNGRGVGLSIVRVSDVVIKNLTVKSSHNIIDVSGGMGGGIFISGSNNVLIQSCRLTQNSAESGGGGLYAHIGTKNLTIDHCLVDNNHAGIGGGIFIEPGAAGIFTNITVVDNSANYEIGGLEYSAYQNETPHILVKDSIFWNNVGPMSPKARGMNIVGSANFGGRSWSAINPPVISHSDIGGWSGGADNISSDPMFLSVYNYHLQMNSPAIGMGAF